MSASREKQTRRSQVSSGMEDPKTAREAQQRKAEQRSNQVYITIAVVFVLVAAATLVWKSNIIQKKATAVTIDGENYTATEVNYYFRNEYQYFVSQYYSYLSMFGLDTSKDLKSQAFSMGEDGETWYDYFLDQALTQLKADKALNDAADEAGFDEWNDSMQSNFDTVMENQKSNAENSGYSLKEYLKLGYGSGMTQSAYEARLKYALRASAYSSAYKDSLTYTTQQLTDAYNADPNAYDRVSYESVSISGAVATTDADGNTVDVTDEMKTDAMAAAKKTADSIYASYQSGGSLSALADAQDGANYTNSESGTYSSSTLYDWLFDASRKAGDSAVLEDSSSSMYYVVVFRDRYRQDYNTIDVRHILVRMDTSDLDSSSDTYDEDLQKRKDETKAKAEEILNEWKSGDATEDSFAALANEKSEDSGSNTNGGLYTRVHEGAMVEEFNDWCFDASRKAGDTGIVYGESSNYQGYHVVYFVGEDLPCWQADAFDNLQSADYNEWYSGLTEKLTADQHDFGMRFVG